MKLKIAAGIITLQKLHESMFGFGTESTDVSSIKSRRLVQQFNKFLNGGIIYFKTDREIALRRAGNLSVCG